MHTSTLVLNTNPRLDGEILHLSISLRREESGRPSRAGGEVLVQEETRLRVGRRARCGCLHPGGLLGWNKLGGENKGKRVDVGTRIG
ncbi:hypothetical protein EON65_06810 [archaeon]|nr:MAG: hypothetical protein EON65_06810 [archaeon]